MISWAGRESLTISDFSSLTCDQADLRFSRFLWEAWSKVIFATSNVNRNRFHCLIECHINTIIMRNSRPLPRTRRWVIVQWLTGRQRKTGLNYKRDVCDALVASRPWNDCIQKSSIKIQSWLKSKWSRIQWHSNKKINVLVWTNGVSWTILDDWRCKVYEGWASFGKSSHVAGSNGNQKSHPVLSNMAQPQQGSWRMDTWRE